MSNLVQLLTEFVAFMEFKVSPSSQEPAARSFS